MSRVNVKDLSPRQRQQIEAALDKPRRRSTQRTGWSGPQPGRCGCGKPMASYAAFERHSSVSGHRRFELVSGDGQ